LFWCWHLPELLPRSNRSVGTLVTKTRVSCSASATGPLAASDLFHEIGWLIRTVTRWRRILVARAGLRRLKCRMRSSSLLLRAVVLVERPPAPPLDRDHPPVEFETRDQGPSSCAHLVLWSGWRRDCAVADCRRMSTLRGDSGMAASASSPHGATGAFI